MRLRNLYRLGMAHVRRLRPTPDDAAKKRAAAEALLAAEPAPVPADVAELKREIREARSLRGL